MVMVRELDPLPHFYQYPSLMPILSAVVVAAVHGLGGPTLETGQPWLLEREVLPEQFAYFLATRLLVLLEAPASSTELAVRLGVTPAAVNQHLRALRAAGLLTSARHGRSVLYLRSEIADQLVRINPGRAGS